MEKKTQNYKDLVVWQKGISLAKAIYRTHNNVPRRGKIWARRANATRRDFDPLKYR